jgi:hypothetical protein
MRRPTEALAEFAWRTRCGWSRRTGRRTRCSTTRAARPTAVCGHHRGRGGAAHLPGMVASATPLPVIGVPVPLKHLDGLDSLLSIVQMPAGVPVATVSVGGRATRACSRCASWPRPTPAAGPHGRHPAEPARTGRGEGRRAPRAPPSDRTSARQRRAETISSSSDVTRPSADEPHGTRRRVTAGRRAGRRRASNGTPGQVRLARDGSTAPGRRVPPRGLGPAPSPPPSPCPSMATSNGLGQPAPRRSAAE